MYLNFSLLSGQKNFIRYAEMGQFYTIFLQYCIRYAEDIFIHIIKLQRINYFISVI
jgi:hypothetical protein